MIIKKVSEFLLESKLEDLMSNYDLNLDSLKLLKIPSRLGSYLNLFDFYARAFKVGKRKHIVAYNRHDEVILHKETSDYQGFIMEAIHKMLVQYFLDSYKKIYLFGRRKEEDGTELITYRPESFKYLKNDKYAYYINLYIRYVLDKYSYDEDYVLTLSFDDSKSEITLGYSQNYKTHEKIFSYKLNPKTIRAMKKKIDKLEQDSDYDVSLLSI
jgi:hypothetical protein